jgi:flagellar biogenesis protein FliO
MSRRWPTGRSHEDDEPASAEFSRLFVMGAMIAVLLGLLTGLGWMAYQFLRQQFGG